jgi:hypothetical protein
MDSRYEQGIEVLRSGAMRRRLGQRELGIKGMTDHGASHLRAFCLLAGRFG